MASIMFASCHVIAADGVPARPWPHSGATCSPISDAPLLDSGDDSVAVAVPFACRAAPIRASRRAILNGGRGAATSACLWHLTMEMLLRRITSAVAFVLW